MKKIYFNTRVFKPYYDRLCVTDNMPEADLLVMGAKAVDIEKFVNLKAVYRCGVGVENIPYKYLNEKNIPLYLPGKKTREILFDATANFTVNGIFKLLYSGSFGDIETWTKKDRPYIGNKRALVIGTGNIGEKVAKKLKPFVRVFTYDIKRNEESELKDFIKAADIVTIHIPLNAETRHFFDKEKLEWIKSGAILINTARGELFDEDALYQKLKTTDCRAFFDVFWREPYRGKLKELGSEKFLMSPHTASNTKEFIEEAFKDILNILKGLDRE